MVSWLAKKARRSKLVGLMILSKWLPSWRYEMGLLVCAASTGFGGAILMSVRTRKVSIGEMNTTAFAWCRGTHFATAKKSCVSQPVLWLEKSRIRNPLTKTSRLISSLI